MLKFILLFIAPFLISFIGLVFTEFIKLKKNENLQSYKVFVEVVSIIITTLLTLLSIQLFIYFILI